MPHVDTTYFVRRSRGFTLLLLQYDKFIFAYVYEILIMSQVSSRGIEHRKADERFAIFNVDDMTHAQLFSGTPTNDAENSFLIAQLYRNNH